MARLQVQAGRTLLESYVRTPPIGLCELVWNAFDEDAKKVEVIVDSNGLSGIERITVADDGNGMNLERAEIAFSRAGDSWKLAPGTHSSSGRAVHGKYGRGRFAAFALGDLVTWTSTSEAVEGGLLSTIRILGNRSDLQYFEIETLKAPDRARGTEVSILQLTDEAIEAFDRPDELRQRLLTEFALHLSRYEDFSIEFMGTRIVPSKAIDNQRTLDVPMPEGCEGQAKLTVIEWNLTNVERRLYLCNEDGAIMDELTTKSIHAPGAEFTAYLAWDGFETDQPLLLEGESDDPRSKVLSAARELLREFLKEGARRREAETVKRWRAEGVYPYRGEPKSSLEKATRETFNVVALAASRTIDEAKSRNAKGLALSLLRETFEKDPEGLLPILREVTSLPAARLDELKVILEQTSLSHLIQMGREVGDRIEFLNGLNAILFDRRTRSRLLERRQLHRILANQTWIFGEEWSLTGDDERLSEVLKKYLSKLDNAELVSAAIPVEEILREDGRIAIPDLVLGRSMATNTDRLEQLVVELKRPNHKLNADDVTQLRSYASAITNDERFAQPNVHWDFVLVGNDLTREVQEMREAFELHGLVQPSKRYRLFVLQWAELISAGHHRLKFVQNSLQYQSDRDSGLAWMREHFGEYLPPLDEPDEVGPVGGDGADLEPEAS